MTFPTEASWFANSNWNSKTAAGLWVPIAIGNLQSTILPMGVYAPPSHCCQCDLTRIRRQPHSLDLIFIPCTTPGELSGIPKRGGPHLSRLCRQAELEPPPDGPSGRGQPRCASQVQCR